MKALRKFIHELEMEVMLPMVEAGKVPLQRVSVRDGRLCSSAYGKALQKYIRTDVVMAVDYYGHIRKSGGFFDYFTDQRLKHSLKQIRVLSAPLIHFSSLKIEAVAEHGPDSLIAKFPKYKELILKLRGYK